MCEHACINKFYATFYPFEISIALNNDFLAGCSDLFRFLIGLSKVMKSFVFCICMGYNGKVQTIFVHAENYTFAA